MTRRLHQSSASEMTLMPSRRTFLLAAGTYALAGTVSNSPLFGMAPPFAPDYSQRAAPDGNILLNSNENPYGPSPRVLAAIQNALQTANRYPDSDYDELVHQLSRLHGVKPEQVLIACGSREVFLWAAQEFLGPGKKLVQATPTFEAPEQLARSVGATVVSVPLDHQFSHDLERMLAQVDVNTTLVYICNPNNPTGTITPRAELDRFVNGLPPHTNVLIDEAYYDYAGISAMYSSFMARAAANERILVSRTFSKAHGLAGLRIGYAVGGPATVQAIRRFAMPLSINRLGIQAAIAAVQDHEALINSIKRNEDDRQEFLNQALARMLRPVDSHTNFFMVDTHRPSADVVEHFRQHRILIGPLVPGMNTHIRVTLGTPPQMKEFWKVWDLLRPAGNGM